MAGETKGADHPHQGRPRHPGFQEEIVMERDFEEPISTWVPPEQPFEKGPAPGLQEVPFEKGPGKSRNRDVEKGILPEHKIDKLQEEWRNRIRPGRTPGIPTNSPEKKKGPTLH